MAYDLKTIKKQKDRAIAALGDQYDNTRRCFAAYNANNTEYQDQIQFADTLGRKKRAQVRFNDIQSPVDSVVGFMAQNRRKAKYIARVDATPAQQLYSKNMNALSDFHRENQNADQIETEQDADMVIAGYGATETDLSYMVGKSTSMPNGEIIKVKLDPERVYWDTSDTSRNLQKAAFAGYWDEYELKQALELFQDSKEDDFETATADDNRGGYTYNPWGGVYDKIREDNAAEFCDDEKTLVKVYNHQWFEFETFWLCENPIYLAQTPLDAMFYRAKLEAIAIEEEDDEQDEFVGSRDPFTFDPLAQKLSMTPAIKARIVREFGKLVAPVSFVRKCFYTSVFSGDHEFKRFKSLSQQGFSIKFKTGTYNRTGGYFIGMVNGMIEPSDYRNKALTELLFAIASNSKGGVMVEENAVESIAEFEKQYAKTDAVIKVANGALSGEKIKPKATSAVPTGLENIISLCDAAIASNGVNSSLMGETAANDNGILYKRRLRQSIARNAQYFDSITLYQKEDSRLDGDLIPVWVENNVGAMVRVAGENGADEFLRISQDMLAAEYDVSIQEAPQTPEDEQETADKLVGLAGSVAQFNPTAGGKFLEKALGFMRLDGEVKNYLVQALQEPQNQVDPEKEQMKALIAQLQSQVTQAEAAKVNAETNKIMSELELNRLKGQQIAAETIKTVTDTEGKELDNKIVKSGNFKQPTVTI